MMVWKPIRLGGLLLTAGLFATAVTACVGVKAPAETGGAPGTGGDGTGATATGGRVGTGGVPGTGGEVITVDAGATGGITTTTGGAGGKGTGGRATGGAATGGAPLTGGKGGSVDGGAGGTSGGAKILFTCPNPTGSSNSLELKFTIVNDGPDGLILSGLSLRYWLLSDDIPLAMQPATLQQYPQPEAFFPKGSISVSLVALTTPLTTADAYIEIKFNNTADGGIPISLGSGGRVNDVTVRWQTQVQPPIMMGNDYSCATGSATAGNKKITAYSNGQLVWGVEPT